MREHLILITVVLLFVFTGILTPTYGQWEGHKISTATNPIPSIEVGDIDGDGYLDVVVPHNVTDEILWYKNINSGQIWEEYTIDDNIGSPWLVRIADIDGDDTMDVVAIGQNANDVVWYENNQLSWTKHYIDASLNDARCVEVADIDGDDTLDVIASSLDYGTVVWYENNHPEWSRNVIETNLPGANYIYASDLDDDGDPDLIVTAFTSDKIVWYENNYPNWNRHDIDTDIDGPVIVDVADLDGDDDPDIAASIEYENSIVWYENDQLSWVQHKIDENLNYALGVAIADIDGNDTLDVIGAGWRAHKVVWYKNNLPSNTWTPYTIDNYNYSLFVKAGDVDRDNDTDVVMASFGYYAGTNDGDLVWYENLLGIAQAKSVECHPKFIPPEGETLVINAQLYNPENNAATVWAMINGEEYAFTDSVQLYDDGLHNDSLAADNIWGNSIWLSGLQEDIYTIGISSHDITEDYTYNLPPTPSFTTKGPVVFDSLLYDNPDGDTEANPGDRIKYYFKLLNEGITDTVYDVSINVQHISGYTAKYGFGAPAFGNIAPGESIQGDSNYGISFSDSCPAPANIPFAVQIVSEGNAFWTDTFYVFVDTILTAIEDEKNLIPKKFSLNQNYPNPFNPKTIINYELPTTNLVDLSIYNLLGQKVTTLVNEQKRAGYHQVKWDAGNFSSGVYYYRIEAGEFQDVKKMILIR